MMNMDGWSQIRLMRHINTMCARSDPDHLGRLLKRKTSVIVYQRHAHRLSHKHTHTHTYWEMRIKVEPERKVGRRTETIN